MCDMQISFTRRERGSKEVGGRVRAPVRHAKALLMVRATSFLELQLRLRSRSLFLTTENTTDLCTA